MNFQTENLPVALHLVATPIGRARDITLRALDVLASADVLAAEDTRTLRKLMDLHGISLNGRPLIPYHDHNGAAARPGILRHLEAGRSVAYASEAGTPLIADPGYALCAAAWDAGFQVTSAPGPSAVVTALSLAGLPSDQFHFMGFLPPKSAARQTALADVKRSQATLVVYEAPGRVKDLLADMCNVLGRHRNAALCRELTKRFEDIRRGTLDDLVAGVEAIPPRGECVVLVERAAENDTQEDDLDAALTQAMATMRIKDAANAVAGAMGLPRREVYQRALALKSGE